MIILCYRVVGATIIIVGLYLVVWGKSKDYKTTTPTIDEPKQITDPATTGKDNSNHQIITINTPEEGIEPAMNK